LIGDLHGAEDGQVDVAAADHREGVFAAEVAGTRPCGDGLLAGVDQVGVDFGVGRERADAQQAVLALQPHVHSFRNEVGHQRRQADAKVDVGAVGEFLRGALRHLVAGPGHGGFLGKAGTEMGSGE
jgi:hypothetical protein